MSVPARIHEAEERLRVAVLSGDVAALDVLLADDVVFVDFMGVVGDKADNLGRHTSGMLRMKRLDFHDIEIRALDACTAHCHLRVEAEGNAHGARFSAAMRYTQLWRLGTKGWQLAAAHSSLIA
ncbi:nuclear transport factor 2 family protein [Ancylobacter sp. A5.8]|uniref:nuclear transport factor 2 family protein n=1 Tax=Ancylobacter gelatini TaxID=2919920 RepID=UPI001F4E25EA|nr:nuclear transport factor 2 family protein [Ancylobacter gelatini]